MNKRVAAKRGALPRYRSFHPGTQPEYNYPPYASTQKRCPTQPLVAAPQTLSELTGPVFGYGDIKSTDNDLTRQHRGEPIGERIVVSGRVLAENGKAVPHTLVEIWQANSSGRYPHRTDQHDAPLDPNFSGAGRTITDAEGRYRFISIRPGEYPWRNHRTPGARRISISRCLDPRSSRAWSRRCIFRETRCWSTTRCTTRSPTRKHAFAWSRCSTGRTPFRNGRSPTASTSCCAAALPRRWSADMSLYASSSQTVGPYLHIG